jgi:hypothetical protein
MWLPLVAEGWALQWERAKAAKMTAAEQRGKEIKIRDCFDRCWNQKTPGKPPVKPKICFDFFRRFCFIFLMNNRAHGRADALVRPRRGVPPGAPGCPGITGTLANPSKSATNA